MIDRSNLQIRSSQTTRMVSGRESITDSYKGCNNVDERKRNKNGYEPVEVIFGDNVADGVLGIDAIR